MANAKNSHYTLGLISNMEGEPLEGLIVRAYDQDLKAPDNLLGKETLTNAAGRYNISFTEKDFKLGGVESGGPDVFIRVFDGDKLLGESPVKRNSKKRINIDLALAYAKVDPNEPARRVHGVVRDAQGDPLAEMLVQAFDRDLRSEQSLGQSRTDKRGFYQIEYFTRQFRKQEKGSADLVIKALGTDGVSLVVSPILFNAPEVAEVNLLVSEEKRPTASEFEKVAQAVTPLLGDLAVVELEENARHQDISFLAGETGLAAERIARFALAHRLRAASHIEAEFWYALLAARFAQPADEQSLGERLNNILAALAALAEVAVRKALLVAFNQRLIPAWRQEKVDAWAQAFLDFVARRSVSGDGAGATLKGVLEDGAIKDSGKQERFARLLAEHSALTPGLPGQFPPGLAEALQRENFAKAEIADLQTTFRVAEVLQGDLAAARVLKKAHDIRQPQQVRTLAKQSEADWVGLVREKLSSGELQLPPELTEVLPPDVPVKASARPAEVYARVLAERFRAAFPTVAFSGGLERALKNGGAKGLQQPEQISNFLARHEEFELLNTAVDEFFDKKLRLANRRLAPAQDAELRQELKAVQRVFKLAPTFEATDMLLADGIHSAQQAYRMGESEFVRRYGARPGFTAAEARHAWNKAADTHAAALTVVGELKALDADWQPRALQHGGEALAGFPNWENLFKSGDLCACEQCRSVYSPAAYFADLLMFLKGRYAKNPARKVKDILFDRRPDLGYLELNCENANTPLPYVDVVCEVLEAVVIGNARFHELYGLTNIPDGSAATKTNIANALTTWGVNLGDFTLLRMGTSDRWVAHGENAVYLLEKKAPYSSNYFAEVLRNTKASADELRANPQYVNGGAYGQLKAARYPFALPFDLFNEEARAAFQKIAVKRWELMQTLRGAAAAHNPSDGEIAAEYFGISIDASWPIDEKRIILNSDAVDQSPYWGELNNAAMLANLNRVKLFLQKTDLKYEELLALLDLKFINQAGDISIEHLDASCDLEQKRIRNLDAAKLDRIHRFLRLWRKLKTWKMWELDLVIRQIGGGNLNEAFLINLMNFVEVRNRLGGKVTVEQTASLFGNLNIKTHFTRLHEKREDALYQSLFLNKRLINPLDAAFELDTNNEIKPVINPVTGLSEQPKLSDHLVAVQAALNLRTDELNFFRDLEDQNRVAYISTDELNLKHLSFLYRHTWLARTLKFKAAEWALALKLFNQDVERFADPRAAWEFLERVTWLRNSGFSLDELSWLLDADGTAKAALKEADAARFLFTLRKELQTILGDYDPLKYPFLQAVPPTDEEQLTALLTALLQQLKRTDAEVNFFLATLRANVAVETSVAGLLPGAGGTPAIVFPTPNPIPVSYDAASQTLRFTGVMTAAQKATLLNDPALPIANQIYKDAIEELFQRPRLVVKFYEPIFSATLASLPLEVDFKAQLPAELAAKIAYAAEERSLRFTGLMTNQEQAALAALSPDAAYLNAVASLAAQPGSIAAPDPRIWLTEAELDPTALATDTVAKRMANAARKALSYLSKALAESAVVQQLGEALGLSAAVARALTHLQLIAPNDALAFFTGAFSTTSGAVDYAGFKDAFDTWYWLNRVALILKKWKINLAELERWLELSAAAQLLVPLDLPRDAAAPLASLERFLRTHRLIEQRDTLPETEITLFEVLLKLKNGGYPAAAFAADLHRLNEDWDATEAERLVNALDLAQPNDYLLAENWVRLRKAFDLLGKLNAGVATAQDFAKAALHQSESAKLKQLLRAKFGTETWLTLSGEIQDALRERKRAALVAWLLYQFKPGVQPSTPAPPSGKWENANDLYAYFLLDAEMSACQLTSRLVQASGSVQLFVQRCLMGLEPDVVVKADGDDGDSAWRWWKWMRKYRVWEANRKVFLYPENWIEPELRRDKSQFFKDLENELQQNEINQHTVETAFTNYLEKLDGVAQLEIAGFYHEDDADRAILHVFGRTRGGEPRIYYYRQYDYRRWTPWEKVDLDIAGDYLIPAVINKRLYLFWPVFTEVPDEEGNNKVSTPAANESDVQLPETKKRLRLQMAVSDYRQGKWSPKKISKEFYDTTSSCTGEIEKDDYEFWLVDRSNLDGRFGIKFKGLFAEGSSTSAEFPVEGFYRHEGGFELGGCKGALEKSEDLPGDFTQVLVPEQAELSLHTWIELQADKRTDKPQNDFTLPSAFKTPIILIETPNRFKLSPAWHHSWMDKLWQDMSSFAKRQMPGGTWLPFFYADRRRTFFVLPVLSELLVLQLNGVRNYYPEIKRGLQQPQKHFEGQIQSIIEGKGIATLPPDRRQALEQWIDSKFPDDEEAKPPYTVEQTKQLWKRIIMRLINDELGRLSQFWFRYRQLHFKNYYHPFVCDFAKLINDPLKGIPALMSRETQLKDSGFSFKNTYQPTSCVVQMDTNPEDLLPREDVDFTPDGAYSPYNWELFFHAPLLIANQLSRNQRFEEAMQWYHFIFNPLGVESGAPFAPGDSPMRKYWITKPFFQTTTDEYVQQRIDTILRMLAGDTSVDGFTNQLKKDLEDQVRDWRDNPFEPHRIAQYRTVAYQKTTLMKYLDNLIAWGDYLFRQDSMESINEATQLFILAAEILGPRPKKVPPQAKPPVETFNELEDQLDQFSNALVQVENLIPPLPGNAMNGSTAPPLPMLYFCIPPNDKLLGYWDTVADRLYKLRHCMNIEGVVRQLALFEPPIDPGALVKAVAGGLDLSSALADLAAPLPLYRFNVLLQQANQICADVRALGGALLAALEKKDTEAFSLLRQSHELKLLDATTAVREQQIEEATENRDGLKKSKELSEFKKEYYGGRDFMNVGEITAIALNTASTLLDIPVSIGYITAGVLKAIPNFILGVSGFGGTPHATAEAGGSAFGDAAKFASEGLAHIARNLDKMASLASTIANYYRRQEEWDFQRDLADKEIEQVNKQIAAADVRIKLAEREKANHLLQIEQAKATDDFMRTKYTNEELYQWHIGQLAQVYFRSYQLAYDLAKRAERCLRFELGLQESNYIQFGYWESLRKGLLAGERLQYDLRRLETAYLEQHRREFELTKHVSLLQLDPLALVCLRETGRCVFRLPEELFDLDYPGHYFRRIKTVSLTLPCVTGPYTTVSCTLRLLKNHTRVKTDLADGYPHAQGEDGMWTDDPRFVESNIPFKAIAASNAQNDSGVFELNFRDERYLPFEGAGAVSEWSLELFSDPTKPDFGAPLRQFDYNTITDAFIHIKYTAREDAGLFKNEAVTHLRKYFSQGEAMPSFRLFNLRQEFPTEWHRFLNPINPSNGNVFEVEISHRLFQYRDDGKTLKINSIWALARCTKPDNYFIVLTPSAPLPAVSLTFTLAPVNEYGGLHFDVKDMAAADIKISPPLPPPPPYPPVKWQLKMTGPSGNLQEDLVRKVMEVEDLLLVLGYEWE